MTSHPSLDRPTTSLNEASGIPLDLETVKEGVIQHFLQGYKRSGLMKDLVPFFSDGFIFADPQEGGHPEVRR